MTDRPTLCTCTADRPAGNDDARAYGVDRPLDAAQIARVAKLLGVQIRTADWATLVEQLEKDADPHRADLFVFLSGGALC